MNDNVKTFARCSLPWPSSAPHHISPGLLLPKLPPRILSIQNSPCMHCHIYFPSYHLRCWNCLSQGLSRPEWSVSKLCNGLMVTCLVSTSCYSHETQRHVRHCSCSGKSLLLQPFFFFYSSYWCISIESMPLWINLRSSLTKWTICTLLYRDHPLLFQASLLTSLPSLSSILQAPWS